MADGLRMVDVKPYSADYLQHTAHVLRDRRGNVTGWRMPQGGAGVEALFDRPPFRRLAGKYATLSGRGRRASQSEEATAVREQLILRAWELRVTQGLTIREIAERVGRSPSLVGRWLRGIPAVGGGSLDLVAKQVGRLVEESKRAKAP